MTMTERVVEAATHCEQKAAFHRQMACDGTRKELHVGKAESWDEAAFIIRGLLEERA